jgi:hypothetical protein
MQVNDAVRVVLLELLEISQELTSRASFCRRHLDNYYPMLLSPNRALVSFYTPVITGELILSGRIIDHILQQSSTLAVNPSWIHSSRLIPRVAIAILGSPLWTDSEHSPRISLSIIQLGMLNRIDTLLDQKTSIPSYIVLSAFNKLFDISLRISEPDFS